MARRDASSIEDQAERIVRQLGGKWQGDFAMCRCPAHADGKASLSIRVGDRAVLFHCFAGCTADAIMSALRSGIALFDKMRRAALIDLLRAECGDASADNCATIKKKADLAVNVSGRLASHWLPAPMQIGAFDQPERVELDDPEADAFDGEGEDMDANEMA